MAKNEGRASPELPDFAELIANLGGLEGSDYQLSLKRYFHHNFNNWRWINGGLPLALQDDLDFDPLSEYWHLTERRVLVLYFAKRYRQSYAPAESMRELAVRVFCHFDLAREQGRFGKAGLASTETFPAELAAIIEVAAELPESNEYQGLKANWSRSLTGDTLRDDLLDFLASLEADFSGNPDSLEKHFRVAYGDKLPWFPFLGIKSVDELIDRQRFFYGVYKLFIHGNLCIIEMYILYIKPCILLS